MMYDLAKRRNNSTSGESTFGGNQMTRTLFALTFGVAALAPLHSQVTCNLNSATPPLVRGNGASELVRDIVMTCTNPGPSVSTNVNIQIFLNVNLTSRIMNPVTKLT